MSLEMLTAGVSARADQLQVIDGILKFDFGDDGALVINARQTPVSVNNNQAAEADCTITITLEDMLRMIGKEVDFGTFYGMGLLDVHGDFAVIMRMQDALSG